MRQTVPLKINIYIYIMIYIVCIIHIEILSDSTCCDRIVSVFWLCPKPSPFMQASPASPASPRRSNKVILEAVKEDSAKQQVRPKQPVLH